MRRTFAFAAGAAMIAFAGTSLAAPDGKSRSVRIENRTSQTIRELYASPITATTWEEDLLGQRELAAGQSLNANIDNGTNECHYDLKAVLADGKAVEQRKVDVCTARNWVIGDSENSVR